MQGNVRPHGVLVTGASGLLGSAVVRALVAAGRPVTGVVHDNPMTMPGARIMTCDLTAPGAPAGVVADARPVWIVHCAALTDVDRCEEDPSVAHRLNTEVPRDLARAADRAGARMLHMSTDAIFDGDRGWYREEDEPRPVNTYARSKLAAEEEVRAALRDEAIVVRATIIGWGPRGKPRIAEWYLTSLRAGRTVTGFRDVVFTPVLVDDLADVFIGLMDRAAPGLFHVASSDACSKYDLGVRIARLFGLDEGLIAPGRLSDASLRARRPLDTSLRSDKVVRHLGRAMPSIDDGLRRFRALEDQVVRWRTA
jgi:dTDP-4-dehydrorhamnose reductase